jgi:hypothetical protein
MMSIPSLRRFLLISAVVIGIVGMALTPAAEAGVHRPAHRLVAAHATEGTAAANSPLAFLWTVLHGAWEAVGSSMDPLGSH